MIFDIADTKKLDNIDIVYDYVGIDADALYKNMYLNDAIVIVSSTADGELSEELSEAVSGKNAGIVVVSCSEDVYMKVILQTVEIISSIQTCRLLKRELCWYYC